ncbi:MAG: EAL domain-containing protein [Wenzhouxiangella sp.]|nr:MAG: EAL domain-containing protein [Wenzhouxiangella sp.]
MSEKQGENVGNGDLHKHIRQYQELVGSDIHFAFQTIMDSAALDVVAFEALVRGIRGEPAATVISRIDHDQRFAFDQACRIRAIEAASRNELDADLHLNCSDVKPANVELVCAVILHMARRYGIERERIVLELANLDTLCSRGQLDEVSKGFADAGLRTLADNFGRRNADLRPVALFRPEQLKLDRHLVQAIDQNLPHQAIVHASARLCRDLGIRLIAAGVETIEEFQWLQDAGIERFQGYFFSHPGLDEENI